MEEIIDTGTAFIKYGRGRNAPATPKRIYRLGEFIRKLTDDEWGVIKEVAQTNTAAGRRAKRLVDYWIYSGVDFNDGLTQQAMNFLVANTTEWTQERVDELSG